VPAERSGIRPGVREQLFAAAELGASDRAALQSLIPLAGALGAGTIFSLFAGTRRGAALRVFEIFAIVAVLTAAGSTAAIAIDLLHADQPIGNRELTQTAMPLVIATLLLIVVSVFNRVSGSVDRMIVLLPMVAVAIFAAAELAVSSWSVDPGSAIWVVMLILLVGLALSLVGWGLDRQGRRAGRRTEQGRVRRLVELGYEPTTIALAPALPTGAPGGPALSGWARGEVTVLDYEDAERLRDLVRARWDALADGEAAGPVGPTILLDVHLEHWIRHPRGSAELSVTLLSPGAKEPERRIDLPRNEDRLFDISPIVARPAGAARNRPGARGQG
jgi:hypothetical protein